MSSPKLKYVEIDGTDVSDYVVTFQVVRSIDNAISEAIIKFNYNILNVIDFDETNAYHTIEIYRGVSAGNETCIFKGEIYTFDKDGVRVVCNCKCELFKAVRSEVTKSFDINIDTEAGKISEIFSTLMEDYAGLTATVGDTVTDSGSVITISKFICNHADVYERCEKLADFLDWTFYYEPNEDKVYFNERGSIINTTTLQVGVNVTNKPVWKYDKTKLTNYYTIIGGEDLVETEESFNGDGSEDTFQLSFTPDSVRVEVGGTLQVGGNDTTSTTFDYSVDKENKQIVFETASIPGVGVGNVIIYYSHYLPRPIIAKNDGSIATYGYYKKTSFITELKDIDDVTNYARQYVAIYKDPFVSTKLEVIDADDIFPGQQIPVVDTTNNINTTYFISKVEMFYPYSGDIVYVGDEEIRTKGTLTAMNDRLRRIEEEMGKNQDKLTKVEDISMSFEMVPRYFKKQKRSITGSVFVFGNLSYGILGTSKLGDSGFSAYSVIDIVQGNNKYKEYCYDGDFNDVVNTTATFSTVTKDISFTSGQVWYSLQIALGTTYKYVTLNCKNITGTLKYEISADNGSNWQTLTLATKTALTSSDSTGVILRITENGSSTAKIENTTDTFGSFTYPAIELELEE